MPKFSLPSLPVSEVLSEILKTLSSHNKLVLEAPPGAGKTTLIPLALLQSYLFDPGKILVLEPRRLAARAAAYRMAQIIDEPVGQTIGYRVRLENKISEATRIEVVTEGILIRLIQEDPALEGISALIFDEFHERSLQADLGLALALDAQAVLRPDIKIIIMSATLDAEKIGIWLNAPVISSKGQQFEVKTEYILPSEVPSAAFNPGDRIKSLVPKAINKIIRNTSEGDILVFLPGMSEIRKVAQVLEKWDLLDIELHTLHGELSLDLQQAAIQPGPKGKRKVVLATSIAETSLTIEGVKVVIDGGFSRIPKFIYRTGITSLVTTPVSKAAAYQRRGRAGRLGPGFCYRLWTLAEHHQLPDHLNPEILEADLSSLKLELAIWGNHDTNALQWLDTPPAVALAQAKDVLQKMNAILPSGQPTAHGKTIASLGMQPRLGHLVIRGNELGYGSTACTLAAFLSERDFIKRNISEFSSPDDPLLIDIRTRIEILMEPLKFEASYHLDKGIIKRINNQADHLKKLIGNRIDKLNPEAAGILLALAYPDRLAKLDSPERVRLITGHLINLNNEVFVDSEYFSIAYLDANFKKAVLAAPLSKNDLLKLYKESIEENQIKYLNETSGKVISKKIKKLGALIIDQHSANSLTQKEISEVFFEYIKSKGVAVLPWDSAANNLRQRLVFLHHHFPEQWKDFSDDVLNETLNEWLYPHLFGVRSLEELAKLDLARVLLSMLEWNKQQELEKLAPTHLQVPSGSKILLNYSDPEAPFLAVRLQEIFGLTETPRIAGGKVIVLLHLLSPAFRPVQVTQDLNSFWKSGYFEVKKDLRGRYPKHTWPEDPLTAQAIRGAKKRNK
ncbi:ATP-dependent helicase HrpB [soil metagenome]